MTDALSNYCHEMYMFKYWDLGTNQQIYHNQNPFIMEQAVLRPERFDTRLVINTENKDEAKGEDRREKTLYRRRERES